MSILVFERSDCTGLNESSTIRKRFDDRTFAGGAAIRRWDSQLREALIIFPGRRNVLQIANCRVRSPPPSPLVPDEG